MRKKSLKRKNCLVEKREKSRNTIFAIKKKLFKNLLSQVSPQNFGRRHLSQKQDFPDHFELSNFKVPSFHAPFSLKDAKVEQFTFQTTQNEVDKPTKTNCLSQK